MFNTPALYMLVYEEEADAVYYMRRGDDFLLSKYFKFTQMPRNRDFLLFLILGLLLIVAPGAVRSYTGIPFAHAFLIVSMLPVSWMSWGFVVRGFLICYFYPSKIRAATGKNVYVDVLGKHQPLDKAALGKKPRQRKRP